jgi:hypothetical protein
VPEWNSGEAQGLAMRWMRLEKLLKRRQSCPALEVGILGAEAMKQSILILIPVHFAVSQPGIVVLAEFL